MIKELHRVVVTGMGVISPIGNNISDFWDNSVNGKNDVKIQNLSKDN